MDKCLLLPLQLLVATLLFARGRHVDATEYLTLLQISATPALHGARSRALHGARSRALALAVLDAPRIMEIAVADSDDDDVLFQHIPKTAGTSIEDAGKSSDPSIRWGRFGTPGYMQLMPDENHCSMHHVPASLLDDPFLRQQYEDKDVFCVVRNPYERIVSEYSYRLSVHGVPKHFIENSECTPEGLNFFVQQALLSYSGGKPFSFDCHLLPQHEYIYDSNGKQWCNEVLKMEDFPNNFNALMEQKGLPVHLTDTKSFSFDNRCPFLSVNNLTSESLQMIEVAYAEDFDILGFDAKVRKDRKHRTTSGEAESEQQQDLSARAAAKANDIIKPLAKKEGEQIALERRTKAVDALSIDPFGLKGLA